MMSLFESVRAFRSLDEIQLGVLHELLERGSSVAPRSETTLELLGTSFRLTDPRARCLSPHIRRWSFQLAVAEFCWHVSGSNDLSALSHYAPIWRDFSDDLKTISGSCYGRRIFSAGPEGSQWGRVRTLLLNDPSSRRAVIDVADFSSTQNLSSRDVSCAVSIQFLLRNGKLHCITHMRSNDVIWGLPYDVFLFTMLQEMMSVELDVELGEYVHFAASMHLYQKHFQLARRMLEASPGICAMEPMPSLDGLRLLLDYERNLRSEADAHLGGLPEYWRALASSLEGQHSTPADSDLAHTSA